MKKKLFVNENRDGLMLDGKPFFYFADTVWSVFSNATVEEWEEYLNYRRMQAFNAVQISVLPILHDASNTYTGSYPFELLPDGRWDFHRINGAFFDKAEKMVQMACEKGFLPVLVVLWNCYVPGAWANRRVPQYGMPKEAVEPYTKYVVNRFDKYNPVYFISGDTRFENEDIIRYFQISLDALKEAAPDALTAMHVVDQFHELPESFVHSNQLELYIYQSGHKLENQRDNYRLAEHFLQKPVRRPVINSEPPYEGHGHGNLYGRFNAFDIRRAFWFSVLGGAKAGFTYGAHGVWSWHKQGAEFTSESWSKVPFEWRNALRLKGAWDAAYSKWLFETYQFHDIRPANEFVLNEYEDIRMAAAPDMKKIVIYAPYSNDIKLKLINGNEYDFVMIDLESRNIIKPSVGVDADIVTVTMSEGNTDVLIIGSLRNCF
ncbi:MAG: hypothetical protein K0S39_5470 [Paenibacillus sp.]|jgi:hypothetical protein|nr:hypothetical protein [Paenibacillus sp.]